MSAEWAIGQRCMVQYEDGEWYEAEITGVFPDADNICYSVQYCGSELAEYVYPNYMRPVSDADYKHEQEIIENQARRSSTTFSLDQAAKDATAANDNRKMSLTPQWRVVIKILESESYYVSILDSLKAYIVTPLGMLFLFSL